ncbi:MAG: hypothetical protein EXR99_08725 [Gemmataceae bacterium]|nr:hypothetical protein [Gemmataceae bacterium]
MKQILVYCKNQLGLVQLITEKLGEAGVNIEFMDAESVEESVVVVMKVDQAELAMSALSTVPCHVLTEESIVVKLEDKPGEMARLLKRFSAAGIDLHSVRVLQKSGGKVFVAIGTRRTPEVIGLVRDLLVGSEGFN